MTRLPRFEEVARVRPVALVAPGMVEADLPGPGTAALPQPAPYVALTADVDGPAELALTGGGHEIVAVLDGRRGTALRVDDTTVRSRRHGRSRQPVDALALTVTGPQATVFTRSGTAWTARARLLLTDLVDTTDPRWLDALELRAGGGTRRVSAGAFGQLGLRDLRLVTNADGTAYAPEGRPLLTATSAGPGFFGTGHASVWELDPGSMDLRHRSDLYFRRGEAVYGDHAVHLVRDGDHWLVATSTWGDFVDPSLDHVHVELGRSADDLLTGRHVVATEPLPLPTTGLRSVGVWDPHLVRDGGTWLVGYVSARRYFDFHPVLATGPSLDSLTLRAAATERRATEGTTLVRTDLVAPAGGRGTDGIREQAAGGVAEGTADGWLVLASDGRDNRRRHRAAYPVFDLDLRQVDTLDAPYPTNLPWPTLVPGPDGPLLVGFDGTPTGGRLPGYGTHGAVVISRGIDA